MSISCLSHFLEDPCSFYWRIVLETKILVLNVLIATGMLLFPGHFRGKKIGRYVILNSIVAMFKKVQKEAIEIYFSNISI